MRERIEVADASKLAASNMIDTAVGTTVRTRKSSRAYAYEQIMLRISSILWRNIRKGSLLVLPYRLLLGTKGREKRLKAVRGRRGISSVIGEVLILAIVIGLMTGVIVFYNALVGPIQQDSKSTAQQAEVSLKERFLIEDVELLPGNKMNVTVFNFGDISLSIATVYINGIVAPFDVSPPSLIGQNSSGSFVLSYNQSSDGTYKIKVVTGRGTMSESTFSS
ncbi:MAG: hypothetical protein ABSG74_09070 [Candidatus Bathyarchaeia archaeon]